MGGRASKRKGATGELEVVKLLSEWWKPVEPEAQWARTPASGGWSRPQVRAGFRASGDILTTAEKFPFSVEIKRREKWSWKNFLAGKQSPIWGWWKQALKQSEEMSCFPLLFFRHNRESWFVMGPGELGHIFDPYEGCGIGPRKVLPTVDTGEDFPCVVLACTLFKIDPERFAKLR